MTKEKTTLTIDSDILRKAKNQIPNISGFVEDCLRNYLGEGNGLTPTSKMQELVDTISKCQLELYLMNEKSKIDENKQKAEIEKINYTWRQLFKEYRDTQKINRDKLESASEILEVSPEELTDIVEVLYVYCTEAEVDITDWFEVYKEYGYGGK